MRIKILISSVKEIGGLVNNYGGTKSSMAIRRTGFRMPMATNYFEQFFVKLSNFNNVFIDSYAPKL